MFEGTATAAIGIHPTKAWLAQLVNFKNAIWLELKKYLPHYFSDSPLLFYHDRNKRYDQI